MARQEELDDDFRTAGYDVQERGGGVEEVGAPVAALVECYAVDCPEEEGHGWELVGEKAQGVAEGGEVVGLESG